MSRKLYSRSKQLVVAAALALGASGVAVADDSSMYPFIGDSYRYFNGGNLGVPGQLNRSVSSDAPADPAWRQSHPNGLTQPDLQALSSSALVAGAFRVDHLNAVFANAAADPSWRQSHPNGLTERELQAASSSALAKWQFPSRSGAASAVGNVAQSNGASLAQK